MCNVNIEVDAYINAGSKYMYMYIIGFIEINKQ